MRRVGFTAIAGAVMIGALGGVAASPAWAVTATHGDQAIATATLEAAAAQGSGITVGAAGNQATGDVLGLGYEQVVRIDGSAVVIAEPQTRGGAELRRFEAELDVAWPRQDPADPQSRALYYGGGNLADVVKHEASRITVLGDRIFVSRLLTEGSAPRAAAGSEVAVYTADGVQKAVTNLDGDKALAVTALDAYEHEGRQYLAVGLNTRGVQVLHVEHDDATGTDVLSTFRRVGEQFNGRFGLAERDQSTVVKLGTDGTGRLTLIAGQMTYEALAVIASDLHVEAGDEAPYAATTIWQNNYRDYRAFGANWQYPDLVEFGRLGGVGAQSPQLVAIAWPTLGRVSLLDAETGHDVTWRDGAAAQVVRFFTGTNGTGYVAIARDASEGVGSFTIATVNGAGELMTVREGSNDELPTVIAELAGE
jgi:hypothetical protein